MQRRLVGIDLGIASAHTVRVLDEAGRQVCRRKTGPTVAELSQIADAALDGAPAGTRLEVVLEPTGPAWLPVAVFFAGRGHAVFRVSSAKAADLRRFLSRHAKSNGIDADTLARLPLIDPGGLRELELPDRRHAALDRRVRATDRLTRAASEHKMRIAVELYRLYPAMPFTDLAAEVATEVRLLRAITTELAEHAAHREDAYRRVDPAGLARSLPGLATIGAPALVALVGDATRFPSGRHFRSFTGLAPRASETGDTDRKGQPMSKAGPALLRTTLVRAADNARRQDPQLARIYYRQIVERGANHTKALCIVAATLAERAWTVLHRGTPYLICDTHGTPVDPATAKEIIAVQWTVPPEVRARRRSGKHTPTPTKAGKAPQRAHAGRDRSDTHRCRQTRRPSPPTIVTRPTTGSKTES